MKAKSKGFNPNYEIISLKNPTSIVSECYRRVKVSLDNLSIDKKIQVIQFCSSTKNEGKSSCCVNTAACYVEAGQKVLIIDLDLRRPTIHRYFNLKKENGISDYLSGNLKKETLIKKTTFKIDVITAGNPVTFPTSLLGSVAMKNLVEELRKEYDIILIDCPPILLVSDTVIISRFCDGCLFVVSHKYIKKDLAKEAVYNLKKNKVNILGAIYTLSDDYKLNNYYYHYEQN